MQAEQWEVDEVKGRLNRLEDELVHQARALENRIYALEDKLRDLENRIADVDRRVDAVYNTFSGMD